MKRTLFAWDIVMMHFRSVHAGFGSKYREALRLGLGLLLCLATVTSAAVATAAEQEDNVAAGADEESQAVRELYDQMQVPHKILFEAYENDNFDLFIMNADGTGRRNLTNTPKIHEHYPQATMDGTKICFVVDVGDGAETLRAVYYMNADGSGRTLVGAGARQPCWSPDGTKIAFLPQEFSKFNVIDYATKGLFIYDLITKKTVEVPNKKVHHLYNPTWSADGKWIIATVHAGMGHGHAILAISLEGQEVVALQMKGCRPCLSPDGKKVTWSSDDHTINIADISYDPKPRATNVKIVHHVSAHLYHPDFSPDGRYVTFSVGPGGRMPSKGPGSHVGIAELVGVCGPWDLYVKRATGEGPVLRLTRDPSTSNKESEWLPVAREGASQ